MIKLKTVRSEIQSLTESSRRLEEKEQRKASRRVEFLRLCERYLETQPSEQYLEETRDRLAETVKKIDAGFTQWVKNTPEVKEVPMSKRMSYYNRQMNRSKFVSQIKALNYVLS